MPIGPSEAREIALRYLDALERSGGIHLILLDELTVERSFGWIFFYDSREHRHTGNIADAIAGNSPLVVTRADGRIHETGTALPLERYLKTFESYSPSHLRGDFE